MIVLDGCRVLLFRAAFPDSVDVRLWITPGGGLEPGETHEQAAHRELREKTGLSDVTLGACVWTRRHVFWWIDAWIEQLERYYLLRAPGIVITPPPLDVLKKEYLLEHRWWSIAEITAAARTETAVYRRRRSMSGFDGRGNVCALIQCRGQICASKHPAMLY